MSENKNNPIDLAASAWVVRLDKGEPTVSEHSDFERWLKADSRHQGAYIRAKAAWQSLDRLRILPAGEKGGIWIRETSRRRGLVVAGGAALSAVALVALGLERGHGGSQLKATRAPGIRPQEIKTAVGEVHNVPLSDGSLVSVNTDSLLNVSMETRLRAISLDRGEAWFQVAKDANRPFVVSAGTIQVRAIGTAFSVRRHEYGADVLVTEGVVETWSDANSAHITQVGAGAKVFISNLAGPSNVIRAPAEIDRALAWRRSEIVLDGQSLSEAAEEFNRYNLCKVTIDPELRQKPLVGWFHTNDPKAFAHAAAVIANASIVEDANEIHLVPKR